MKKLHRQTQVLLAKHTEKSFLKNFKKGVDKEADK